jgi:hypothetical protein
MSSLGQLSGRISKNLKRVDELTKALIAIRAELLEKTVALKIKPEAVVQAKATVAAFLEALGPVLEDKSGGNDEQKLILQRLTVGGRQPSDYGSDFLGMAAALRGNVALTAEQLNKISEVVGYLQGEVAEEVRRLRSR